MFNKVLVGVDGSDPSVHALEVAAGVTEMNEGVLVLVTVVPPLPPMVEDDTPHHPSEFSTDLRESYERMITGHKEKISKKHPKIKVKALVKEGSPSRKIIETAGEVKADLIVVGNRGKSGILSWVLGSVSRNVTDACTVPVLVVKNEKFCKN